MWIKFKRKNPKITIGLGRFVEITEKIHAEPYMQYRNPKMRIECNGSDVKINIKEWIHDSSIKLSKEDAIQLADAINEHFNEADK